MSKVQDIINAMSLDLACDIEEYLDDQPHNINCAECGCSLDFTSTLDPDGDLMIEVELCETCIKEVAEEL